MAVIKSNSITFIDNAGVERYLYIRYSNDGEAFTEPNGTTPGEWLGICSSNSPIAPTDFSAYTWNKVQGNDGKTLYTWIKYADDINGTNMSNDPNGKMYMGIAYNKETSTESESPEDYDWSLIASRGIDRIEEWYATTENDTDTPVFGENPGEIPKLSSTNKYLWNKEITYFTDGDTDETEPVIIGTYGDSGIGIKDIENYYTTTKKIDEELAFPDTPNEPPKVDSENKYLWNYEKIIYTDNTYKSTEPAIIGVYGDEGDVGADAITFKIYSAKGFEFVDSVEESEKIETIILQTMSSKGIEQLTNVTYQWFYVNENDEEIDLDGKTNSSLEVNVKDEYAFFNLGCKMYYEENIYRDYRTLSKKTDVYTATIKFFDGDNIFKQGEEYIVGYVELYKNGKIAETVNDVENYCPNIAKLNNGTIEVEYTNPNNVVSAFFICEEDGVYDVVLGEYSSNSWIVKDYKTNYVYKNNINTNVRSNIFIIHKSKISRSQNVIIDIFTSETNEESFIATTNVTIVDLNDTTVGSTAPSPPNYDGQLWLDTSKHDTNSDVLKVYNAETSKWEFCSEQKPGQSIYASKPLSYKAGDLWVVEDNMFVESYISEYNITEVTAEDEYYVRVVANGEVTYTKAAVGNYEDTIFYTKYIYGPSSMLRAIVGSDEYNAIHWEDALEDVTKLVSNVTQYMTFSPKNGLKIGQNDEKFFVNIDSQEMGFYEVDDNKNENKVVYIRGNAANITNLTVEKAADFNCGISVDNEINMYQSGTSVGFTWKIESDGSFSLIRIGGVS